MFLTTATSDIIRVITDSTATVSVHASWGDHTTSGVTPGRTNTLISTATTTTVVAAPAVSTQRQVRTMVICNTHASTSVNVTVQYFDGTNAYQVFKANLLAGYSMEYNGQQWNAYDDSGRVQQVALSNLANANLPNPMIPPGQFYTSSNTSVVAAGTTQGTATAITVGTAVVTSTPVGTGVVLPTPTAAGLTLIVRNNGVNTLNVYPASGGAIDSYGTNNPKLIGTGVSLELVSTGTTQWVTIGQIPKYSAYYDAVLDFGFVGDLQQPFVLAVGYDGAITSGTATLVCATTTPFTANDVGKRITVAGAGASGAVLVTTISVFTSSSQVTLAANAGTTVSAANVQFGTDNTAAITSMVTMINTTNANNPTPRIYFPPSQTNVYGFPTVAAFNKPCIIEGTGAPTNTDIGDYRKAGGTCLAWWGTSSDGGTAFQAFLTWIPTVGANNTAINNMGLKNIWIDCRNGDQNQALIGVQLTSCHAYIINNVYIIDPLAIGLNMDVFKPGTAVGASSIGEAKDTTRGTIKDLRIRSLDNTVKPSAPTLTATTTTTALTLTTAGQSFTLAAANGLFTAGYVWMQSNVGYPVLCNYTGGGGTTTLTGVTTSLMSTINAPATVSGSNVVQCSPANACAIMMDGDLISNTCCNTFSMIVINHGTTWGPAAIEYRNSDSVHMINVMINGGNITSDGAINRIRKPGIRLNGSATSTSLPSRNNVFDGGSAGAGGVSVMGLNNAGAVLTGPSVAHAWYSYQLGNGEAIPTIERLAYSTTAGNVGAHMWYSLNGGFSPGPCSIPSLADQSPAASTLTHIQGSLVPVPPQGLQVGTTIRWHLTMDKTALGAVANVFHLRLGTAGTTADAALNTFTTGVGTAVADTAYVIVEFTVRTLGAGTATGYAQLFMTHTLAATGWIPTANQVIAAATATYNTSTQGQYLSLSTTMGAAMVATIHTCYAECLRP